MTEKPGIYCIRHRESGRVYVGSTGNISKRWSAHRKALRLGRHRNQHLQRAWAKYGGDSFDFEVLEFTDELDAREQHWMDKLEASVQGFNLCPIARSSRGRMISAQEIELRRAVIKKAHRAALEPAVVARRAATRRRQGTLRQKLTWEDAVAIRKDYGEPTPYGNGRRQRRSGGVTLAVLAARYNVSAITVYDVIRWKTWKSDPFLSPE